MLGFVSHRAFSAVITEMLGQMVSKDTLAAVEAQRDVAQTEVRRLTDIVVGMKREGFHPVAAIPASAPLEDDIPDVVADALDQIGLKGQERLRYESWARRRLEKGTDAEVLASQLLQGGLNEERPDAR